MTLSTDETPWDDIKVAFSCDAGEAIWGASDNGDLILPAQWELIETDSSGARYVAIFRVEGVLSLEDGIAVKSAIEALPSLEEQIDSVQEPF